MMTASFTQPPITGIVVHSLTITTPTAIRPIIGHSSLVRPISHCPTSAPTMTCAKYSDANQTNSVEMPMNSPTTVTQAITAAIGTPHITSTPKPAAAPYSSDDFTASCENFGINVISTSPNRTNAAAQITCHT